MPTQHLTVWTSFHWGLFSAFVAVMLVLDLFVFHRDNREPTFRSSLFWTVFWTSLAMVFCLLVWFWSNEAKAVEFLTGYLVEWSLSMDNVFVFAVVFNFYRVPKKYQYRVLFWGILGAVVMRLVFILVGAELIKTFDWIMWIFGAILIFTGVRLAFQDDDEVEPEQNWLTKMLVRYLPVAPGNHLDKFFVKVNGRWMVTSLFIVLLVIESSDVIFAVDSVPAIFGITRDPFIVYTSNIFAILGLRALYFLLLGFMAAFRYLHYGLSAILIFVGTKMVLEYWLPRADGEHWFSPLGSLSVILGILLLTAVASLMGNRLAKDRE